MTKNDLRKIQEVAEKFGTIETINLEIKKVQSIKCRLKKMKFKSSYNSEMTEVLKYEQILKEAKNLLNPREKYVTEFNEDDVAKLTIEQTIKAIRSIQSKKTLTKYKEMDIALNNEYQNALKIEALLVAHKEQLTKDNENIDKVEKTKVASIIETIENNKDLTQEALVDLLKKLI
jgi:hypothetical protein